MSVYDIQKHQQLQYRNRRKERIIKVMGGKCAICGYDRCNSALELHHLNPNEKEFNISAHPDISWDRTAKELQKCILVCANCHREIHAAEDIQSLMLSSSFDEKINEDVVKEINETKHSTNTCCDCGKPITYGAIRCTECASKHQRQVLNRPEKLELAKLIVRFGFVEVGKQFGVSDNAIRKWCKAYGLPIHKKDIVEYVKQLTE